MSVHFSKASPFEENRSKIEKHLFDSIMEIEQDINLALRAVDQLAHAIDRLMDTLEQMYQNPASKDTEGEKSFPIRDGRYRVFFKINIRPNQDFEITFLDIDDNKQSNLDRFPSHRLITFDEE